MLQTLELSVTFPQLCSLSRDTAAAALAATTTLPEPCPVQSLKRTRSCRAVLVPPPTTWTTARCFVIAHAATDLSNPFTVIVRCLVSSRAVIHHKKIWFHSSCLQLCPCPVVERRARPLQVHATGYFVFVCMSGESTKGIGEEKVKFTELNCECLYLLLCQKEQSFLDKRES